MTAATSLFYAERLDPARNMARFYALEVTEDLFGHAWLERRWGRIGTRGQTKLEPLAGGIDASARIEDLASSKIRRGYRRK